MSAGSELGQTLRGGQLCTPLSTSEPGQGPVDPSGDNNVIAAWEPSIVRYFLVDPVGGDDNNIGYIDAAEGSTLTTAGIPKKTLAGFFAILPKQGAGRRMVLLVANASTSGTTIAESLDFSGVSGYAQVFRRGSTDLTNSTSDQITCGFMQGLVGPNGDGSWTATAGAVGSVTVAAGLTAESSGAGLTYMRVRFKGNVTAGLANVVADIWRNSTTVIEFEQNITSPAIGDEFFIERPGVIISATNGFRECTQVGLTTGATGTQKPSCLVGFAFSTSTDKGVMLGCQGLVLYAGCETRTSTTNRVIVNGNSESASFVFDINYQNEAGTTRKVGGFRCLSAFVLIGRNITIRTGGFGSVTTQSLSSTQGCVMSAPTLSIGGGLTFRGLRLSVGALTQGFGTVSTAPSFGNNGSSTVRRIRFIGTGCIILGGACHFYGAEAEGCTAPCFTIGQDAVANTEFGGQFAFDDCITSPAAGNTDVGIDVSKNVCGGTVVIGKQAVCTLTGTLGDIRLAGSAAAGVINTYTALTQTNTVDINGTNVVGTARSRVSQCKLVVNKEGAALAVGNVVQGNGTSNQVQFSQADTIANATVVGVMTTPPADNAEGYLVAAGIPYVLTDALITPGAICYLDDGTAGVGTPTVPPLAATNAKQRLGRAVETAAVGTASYVTWHPDNLPVLSDGLA